MAIVTIVLATLAGLGTLLYAVFWQTPVAIALAMLTCGGLLTAAFAWYFRPDAMREGTRHPMPGSWRHRFSH